MKAILKNFSRPLHARNADEKHRTATQLELFFDLVVVIALASAASGLHHALSENHISAGLIQFIMAFTEATR